MPESEQILEVKPTVERDVSDEIKKVQSFKMSQKLRYCKKCLVFFSLDKNTYCVNMIILC